MFFCTDSVQRKMLTNAVVTTAIWPLSIPVSRDGNSPTISISPSPNE